jgi:DNA-directed RNA polymerase specialized sigma24 family protein
LAGAQPRPLSLAVFDEELCGDQGDRFDPAQLALRHEKREMVRQWLSKLLVEFREVLVRRELEGMSYMKIATITILPPGTFLNPLSVLVRPLHASSPPSPRRNLASIVNSATTN